MKIPSLKLLLLAPLAALLCAASDTTLPALLRTEGGRTVRNARQWERQRRPEILRMLSAEVYGIAPDTRVETSYRTVEEEREALGGAATRRQVRITLRTDAGEEHTADMLLYIPNGADAPVPVIFGLNFKGNHGTTTDPAVIMPAGPKSSTTVAPRGDNARRWPYAEAVARGYAVATICKDDFFPDRRDGYAESVLPMLYRNSQIPDSVRMKAVGAWAWGISRAIDCLETMQEIDPRRIMVLGHSRLGKTSLWAAATDPRIAIAVSNDSGSTGAALARGNRGETVEDITTHFPYWFTDTYSRYNGRETQMPFDQHMLLALVAPRPLYVASASLDAWADPRNEMRSAQLCGEVYRLYGRKPLTWQQSELPPAGSTFIDGDVAYHLREGGHDILSYDWQRFMDFADKYFKK